MAEPPPLVPDDAEIDPELVRLPRRVPVGPILAASVLGLALLLMWRLRADLAYAGQGDTPVDLGRVEQPGPLAEGAYATLTGRPDVVAPARLRAAQETGHRLAPFLGSGARLWLEDSPEKDLPADPVADGRWTGRLRRLASTAAAAEVAEHVATAAPVPRVVYPDRLGAGLPAADANGDPLAAAPGAAVAVKLVVPDQSRVVFVQTDDIPDEAAARAALARAGHPGLAPVEATASSWSFDVPAAPAPLNAALRAARLFGAAASPKVETLSGTLADLDLRGADAVALAGRRVPRAALDHLVIWVKPSLPDDAWVLVSGDTPAALWYIRPLYVMLAVIAVLMLWALVVDLRQLRGPSGPGRPPAVA
jgi:hypothetical protein